jgi:hypothetical protein
VSRVLMWAVLENLGFFALSGFLCWWFNNGWPLLLLLLANSFRVKDFVLSPGVAEPTQTASPPPRGSIVSMASCSRGSKNLNPPKSWSLTGRAAAR